MEITPGRTCPGKMGGSKTGTAVIYSTKRHISIHLFRIASPSQGTHVSLMMACVRGHARMLPVEHLYKRAQYALCETVFT